MTVPPYLPPALHKLAWVFVLAFGAFCAWGQTCNDLNPISCLLAVVWMTFQAATNLFAVAARHVFARGHWLTGAGLVLLMLTTGLFSHEALANAFAQAQARGLAAGMNPDVVDALFMLAPFLEVMAARAGDLLSGQETAQPHSAALRAPVGAAVAMGIAAGSLGAGQAAGEQPRAPDREKPEPAGRAPARRAPSSSDVSSMSAPSADNGGARARTSRLGADVIAHARALKAANPRLTQEAISAQVGASRSAVQRYLAAHN